MKNKFLTVFLAITVFFSIVYPDTAAASDMDVDIGALICDTALAEDWKVSGIEISRSDEDYARVSGTSTVAGYSARTLGDEAVKLRFRCVLDSMGGWVALMLRSDDPTKALWTAKHTYGLLLRNSNLDLQRWRDGTCKTLALADFSIPEDESFTLQLSVRNENGAAVLSVTINGENIIHLTDNDDPIEESGYFAIATSDKNYIDIYADSNQPGTGTTIPLVYFTGCYEDVGKRFVHWRYNEAYESFSGVTVSDRNGSVLAELKYPVDRYELPPSYTADKIYLTPVTKNGVKRVQAEVNTAPLLPKEASGGRIAVQNADGGAYFYDTRTGEPFIPRGANYIRLLGGDHSTFEAETSAGPADYDPYDAEAALKLMADNGMNCVRVFVVGRSNSNPGVAGSRGTPGVYAPYMDNLVDFITRAKRHGIYVILTFGDGELPLNDHYSSMLSGLPSGHNILYLTEKGMKARSAYLCDVLNYLKSKDPALLEGLLAMELQNELALYAGEWPFDDSNKSAKVTGTDGRVYDMSVDEDRQALADNSIRYYLNFMTNEIKKIYPAQLVCEGSFTYYSVGTTPERSYGMHTEGQDTRLPFTAEVLLGTKLDFLDIHFYQFDPALTPEESFKAQYDSMLLGGLSPEAQAERSNMPIIMGEFGSFKNVDNSKKKVLDSLRGLRSAALEAGLRGMLYWTLDCFEQKNLANLCESSERLSELAQFDIELPKVDISALPSADTTAVTNAPQTNTPPAVTAAAAASELTTDAVSPEDNSNGAVSPLLFVVPGCALILGLAALVIVSWKRNKSDDQMHKNDG